MRRSGIYVYIWAVILNNACNLSDGYKYVRLQDYLCSEKWLIALQKPFRGDPEFTLTENQESAAIVTQIWNTTLPGVHSANKLIKYDCHFRVQTSPKPRKGIYTVITRLQLRHDPVTGQCRDYIKFSGGNRPPSAPICNEISVDGPAGRLIFDERDREVSVHIHIDKRHMITEPLELHMVLTAHSECQDPRDFLCEPKQQYSCISRHFIKDNVTNCMFPCRDEVSCFYDAIPVDEIDATNVAISAITSLIFTMLGVSFCVWVCWKYWNCITVQQHAHEASAAAQRRVAQNIPTIDVPSAPDFDLVVTAGSDHPNHEPQTPKDMPPSYESLFPDR